MAVGGFTGKRAAIALIAACQLAAMALWFSASAVIPALTAEFHLSNFAQAALTSSVQAGFVVGCLASAALGLADRTDPRRLFALAALIGAVANALLLLAIPAIGFQYLGVFWEDSESLARAWEFGAALYAATILFLLRYVFQPDVMTADKLYGAAAGYLMIGVLWACLYAIVDYHYPGSFTVAGTPTAMAMTDLLYFSFTVLTSTGFGDVTPLSRQARSLCVVQQVIGALFVAILIARLAGVYPPRQRETE